jgi:uncharacterized Fe-S center protein
MSSELLFAKYPSAVLEAGKSIGAKWLRLLDQLQLSSFAQDKRIAIKMHLGGGYGFSTIHPYLVRQLVSKLKQAGAAEVFVCDGPTAVRNAVERGYTTETLGCQIVPVAGTCDKYFYRRKIDPPFRGLEEVELAGEIVDADALVDFAHIKGHGCCGFGGASKNLSMGAVVHSTRRKLHQLEGGIDRDDERCNRCGVCAAHCPSNAITCTPGEPPEFNFHECKFCQHCVLVCPQKALSMSGGGYEAFQQGMARTTAEVLKTFAPGNVLFISLLKDITIFCDCWCMTTPSLVPDIGILAGRDIVAIESAALDMIKTEHLIPGSLPEKYQVNPADQRHLFEQVHGKDPFVVLRALQQLGCGSPEYTLREID